jgi:hypothetical protein
MPSLPKKERFVEGDRKLPTLDLKSLNVPLKGFDSKKGSPVT